MISLLRDPGRPLLSIKQGEIPLREAPFPCPTVKRVMVMGPGGVPFSPNSETGGYSANSATGVYSRPTVKRVEKAPFRLIMPPFLPYV